MGTTRKKQEGTAADIARILGVVDSTVSRWSNKPDFPKPSDGKFVLDHVLRWYYRQQFQNELREMLQADGASDSPGLERLRIARAQIAEIELATLRGRVVRMDDFDAAMNAALQPWRRFGEELKRRDVSPEIWALLDECHQQVIGSLEAMSNGASSPETVIQEDGDT